MKRLLFFIALVTINLSCHKEEQIIYSSDLIGEWEWLSTCGGFSGGCGTPQTTNSTAKIIFSQDSVIYNFQNNAFVSSNEFSILRTPVDYTFGLLLIDSRHYLYSIIHDTLNFMPEGADFSSSYKRIK
jgi:hypothetical protein